jgi:hypothetical protein
MSILLLLHLSKNIHQTYDMETKTKYYSNQGRSPKLHWNNFHLESTCLRNLMVCPKRQPRRLYFKTSHCTYTV